MGRPAQSAVDLRDFGGMVSNADSHDLQPGQSVRQVNITSLKRGELIVRRGLKELTFEAE